MMDTRRWIGALVITGFMIASVSAQPKAASPERTASIGLKSANDEWRTYGGDKAFTRYSSLDQINRDNVRSLQVVWRRDAVDRVIMDKFTDLSPSNYFRGTPIIVDG